jgi:hypothetical protein
MGPVVKKARSGNVQVWARNARDGGWDSPGIGKESV